MFTHSVGSRSLCTHSFDFPTIPECVGLGQLVEERLARVKQKEFVQVVEKEMCLWCACGVLVQRGVVCFCSSMIKDASGVAPLSVRRLLLAKVPYYSFAEVRMGELIEPTLMEDGKDERDGEEYRVKS